MEYFDRIISIGEDCSVAGSLRKKKYKEASYLFDWCITKLEFVIESFASKFINYEEIFDLVTINKTNKYNYKNLIIFQHDVLSLSKNKLKEKYLKRKTRLNSLLNSDKKILFIRKNESDSIKEIQKLKNIIKKNYPMLNFKILLINNLNEKNNDKDIIYKYEENIKCFLYKYRKHRNRKLSYECVYDLLNNFESIKFVQPPHRDDSI